jgi:Predicted membrane protein
MDADWLNLPISWLEWTGVHITVWKIIGYTGALMFGGRWLVQFVASKRAGKPVIPRLFWYMSVVGQFDDAKLFSVFGETGFCGRVAEYFPRVYGTLQPLSGCETSRLASG